MKIRVCNICRAFGAKWAANMVNFEVPEGKIFGFIGPNGSGKTTTLRIMAGIDSPHWGDVLYDDISVVMYPEKAREYIGYMPDALPDFSNMKVWEYLDFFARSYGLTGDERHRRLEELHTFTGITTFKDKYLNTLSKGMKQRVSLARALVHSPKVLLLDEPAAGLDPIARHDLKVMLKKLSADHVTILLSSHILSELEDMCDGAVIIKDGHVVAFGTMDQLQLQSQFDTPASATPQAAENAVPTANCGTDSTASAIIKVKIRTLGKDNELLNALKDIPQCMNASPCDNGGVIAELNGGDEAIPQFIWLLLSRDLPVISFEKMEMGLEDVFLKLAK